MNPSDNHTECQPQRIHILIPISLSLLYFCGFILNCISVGIFWFRIKKWNSMTILQFNLAISDVIVTPAAPLVVIYSLTDNWTFGTFLCQFKVFLLSTHKYGSIYFLTLISLHRYFAVVHNVKRSVLTRNSFIKKVSLVVWGCLLFQGLPFFIALKTSQVQDTTKCLSIHQTEMAALYFVWNWVVLFSGLLIPFAVIIICYTLLGRFILKLEPMNTVTKVMKSKSIQTISVTLVIFIICYVPVHITRTILVTVKFFSPTHCELLERVEVVYYITWMLSVTNCCFDPILYCFASDKFYFLFKDSVNVFRYLGKSIFNSSEHYRIRNQQGNSSSGASLEVSQLGTITVGTTVTEVHQSLSVPGTDEC
ncbi:lysophosphatidic acid receptor 6-like [Lissotriton helveticus]